jgi:putative ABC transport system substrate-binding protein
MAYSKSDAHHSALQIGSRSAVYLWSSLGRAAKQVDKMLKGASAAELPIEQPTQLDLAVNLRTARALRITIPQSVLVRATTLVE